MQEKHKFGLVIASTKLQAKNIAKSKWLIGCKKKNKDDISSLEILFSCDDCELINKIGNQEIELTQNNNFVEENKYPDWDGYQKIDGIKRSQNLRLAENYVNYFYSFTCF